jgi:hypothetical protein
MAEKEEKANIEKTEVKSKNSGNGLLKILGISCLVIVFLLVCCFCFMFGVTLFSVNTAVGLAKDDIIDLTCEIDDQDIEDLYENQTTSNFRAETSLVEFKNIMDKIDNDFCKDLEDIDAMQVVTRGWTVSYNDINGITTINLEGYVDSTYFKIKLKEVGNEMKIDYMDAKWAEPL